MPANIKGMLNAIGKAVANAGQAIVGASGATPPAPAPAIAPAPAAKPGGSSWHGLQFYAPAWFPSTTVMGTLTQYIFYTSLFALALFLILLVIHYAVYPIFSFREGDGGIIPMPFYSDAISAYTGTAGTVVIGSESPIQIDGLTGCSYTIAFDVMNNAQYVGTEMPRVLLYRANATGGRVTSVTTEAALATSFPNSNIIVYLDPVKNDMKMAIKTQSGDLKQKVIIPNIPIRKLFRVTIVMGHSFVEVYKNGKLETSFPYTGLLANAPGTNTFWGPVTTDTKIASMRFWPRMLTAGEVYADGTVQTKSSDLPALQ